VKRRRSSVPIGTRFAAKYRIGLGTPFLRPSSPQLSFFAPPVWRGFSCPDQQSGPGLVASGPV
jgi:hypothetical protein